MYIFFIISVILIILTAPKYEIIDTLNQLENKTFDFRQKIISKDKKVNKDIVIITVDDPSYEYLLEKYGEWPIPRNVYAEILDYIQSQNPKYVAFDLMFIKSFETDKKDNLILGNRLIPLTKEGEAVLNWYGEAGTRNNNGYYEIMTIHINLRQ